MISREHALTLAIIGLTVSAVVVAATVYYVLIIRGTGMIKTVGVQAYADPELTKEVSAINWGTISPGGYSQTLLYLKITSNVPSNLTLSTARWSPPSVENYLTLTWDYDGTTLNPGQIIAVRLTLTIADAVTGITNFSFDMLITAAG